MQCGECAVGLQCGAQGFGARESDEIVVQLKVTQGGVGLEGGGEGLATIILWGEEEGRGGEGERERGREERERERGKERREEMRKRGERGERRGEREEEREKKREREQRRKEKRREREREERERGSGKSIVNVITTWNGILY